MTELVLSTVQSMTTVPIPKILDWSDDPANTISRNTSSQSMSEALH